VQDVVISVIVGKDFGQSGLYEGQVRVGLVHGDGLGSGTVDIEQREAEN
jgi:hypothetical protein